ncbi:MAG: ABC transporter ATP-binding protein [Caldilineaceae bacterium]|nr:ABC transporter ATP-binding protein [Caldilineaceae bacterium]MCB0122235.1 ABC transporter ATP-binding protein [Caldilineaceae bacterium]
MNNELPAALPAAPILVVDHLRKLFPVGAHGLLRRPQHFVHAVDDVSFTVGKQEVLAVVGESGCGKSTLVLTLLGMETATAGSIRFHGAEVTALNAAGLKQLRRQVQMIFQDPYESLNPLMTIGETVAEPLRVHGLVRDAAEARRRVCRALEDAGLKPAETYIDRRPHELSGGQRQRVVIAGALILDPAVILADEPVSMLDVSIRAEILNLLNDLRRDRGISIILITHDLNTVSSIADRIAVMYLGRIVEIGTTQQVLTNPQHPYTKALLSVAPVPNPRRRRERIILQGETPDPIHLPSGCRFHPRCPLAIARCKEIDPALIAVSTANGNGSSASGHSAACILLEGHE